MNEMLLPQTSDKFDIVLSRMMEAKAIMGTSVIKDEENPFHKSKYASLGAHLDLCEPILPLHGLVLVVAGNMLNGIPILIATLYHPESSQWIKTYLPLPNPKGDSQGIGASITYMRRYAINSIFSLYAEDDDGETAAGRGKYDKQKKKQEQQQHPAPITFELLDQAQVKTIAGLVNGLDDEGKKSFLKSIKDNFGASALKDIPQEGFDRCVIHINNKIKYLHDKQKQTAVA